VFFFVFFFFFFFCFVLRSFNFSRTVRIDLHPQKPQEKTFKSTLVSRVARRKLGDLANHSGSRVL